MCASPSSNGLIDVEIVPTEIAKPFAISALQWTSKSISVPLGFLAAPATSYRGHPIAAAAGGMRLFEGNRLLGELGSARQLDDHNVIEHEAPGKAHSAFPARASAADAARSRARSRARGALARRAHDARARARARRGALARRAHATRTRRSRSARCARSSRTRSRTRSRSVRCARSWRTRSRDDRTRRGALARGAHARAHAHAPCGALVRRARRCVVPWWPLGHQGT